MLMRYVVPSQAVARESFIHPGAAHGERMVAFAGLPVTSHEGAGS